MKRTLMSAFFYASIGKNNISHLCIIPHSVIPSLCRTLKLGDICLTLTAYTKSQTQNILKRGKVVKKKSLLLLLSLCTVPYEIPFRHQVKNLF